MNRNSIRFRLTAWYTLILALTFAAMGLGTWFAIRRSIQETVDRDLESRLGRMREFLDHLEGGVSQIPEELKENSAFAPAGTQFRLRGMDGKWIYESPDASGWPAPDEQKSTAVVNGKTWRILTARVTSGTLQLGVSLDVFNQMFRTVSLTLLLATPLSLILAAIGGYWMSRRALEPVDQIAARARDISAHNLSGRLPLRGSGDELDRLSATLNAMLARLESAFRKMTQFTADASHELRTPIAIVQTTAEIATSKTRTVEEHERSWRLVLAETERTARLIEDLLTLARADAGSDGLVLESMDLAQCVGRAVSDMRILAGSAGISLSAELPGSCAISGDSDAIRRLCLILLDNGIKYTAAGGNVRVTLKEADPKTAVLEVADTGVGIDAADIPHIFDRFYRIAADRSRKTGGAGLGLAIAQWIACRHGATITIESTPGQGSTFRIRIPVISFRPSPRSSLLQKSSAN